MLACHTFILEHTKQGSISTVTYNSFKGVVLCSLVKYVQLNHFFQVGSWSPRAQLLIPANNFFGAFGMFSMLLKMSSRSALGFFIFPPLVGMPRIGAKRLQIQTNVSRCQAQAGSLQWESPTCAIFHLTLAHDMILQHYPGQYIVNQILKQRHFTSRIEGKLDISRLHTQKGFLHASRMVY